MQDTKNQTSLQSEELSAEIDKKINEVTSKKDTTRKKDTASCVLLIIGVLLFCVAIVFAVLFSDTFVDYFSTPEGERLGVAIGVVVMFVYFGFPCLVISAVSSVFNIISFAISIKKRKLKLIFMILSILLTVFSAVLIILLYAL